MIALEGLLADAPALTVAVNASLGGYAPNPYPTELETHLTFEVPLELLASPDLLVADTTR
jgi:hypothetical protein